MQLLQLTQLLLLLLNLLLALNLQPLGGKPAPTAAAASNTAASVVAADRTFLDC